MRHAFMAIAVLMTGCLHAQAPPTSARKPSVTAVERLVNDPDGIAKAADAAEAAGLRREDWIGIVEAAYWNYCRIEAYKLAAEVAHEFRLDPAYVAFPIRAARRRAKEELEVARNDKLSSFLVAPGSLAPPQLSRGEGFLLEEIEAACRFGPEQTVRLRAVQDAFDGYEYLGAGRRVLYALFDHACPLDPGRQAFIVEAAMQERDYDRALRYAEKSFWTQREREAFAAKFFADGNCAIGFEAAARLKAEDAAVVAALETPKAQCETIFDKRRFVFRTREQAGAFFFAAIKGEEIRLAYELMPYTPYPPSQAKAALAAGAFEGHDEIELHPFYKIDAELKDIAMAWALGNGRARYVGMVAHDPAWERRAFDKLVEQGAFDDAAEVADYGSSESFRKHGIGLAFVAAVKAKDLDMVRYFLHRYDRLLSEESYRLEWKKAHGDAAPELYPKRKKIPKRKPCKEADDWEVRRTCS